MPNKYYKPMLLISNTGQKIWNISHNKKGSESKHNISFLQH